MTRITFISDSHNKHKQLNADMPGGQIIVHAGDSTAMGWKHEIENFCKWFDKLNYDHKVFIAGNHDHGFQKDPETAYKIIQKFKLNYLQDSMIDIDDIKIWGSPWQPEFYNWAFNLPRNGWQLAEKWNFIPENIDILITHGPSFGILDKVIDRQDNLGCELLAERLKIVKPKIHVFGHIHSGYGYKFDGITHHINASVLNEGYEYANKPLTIDWNKETNELIFL